jgi:hypothetical protein
MGVASDGVTDCERMMSVRMNGWRMKGMMEANRPCVKEVWERMALSTVNAPSSAIQGMGFPQGG